MPDPTIGPELVAAHGLSEEEYSQILEILGREPSYVELGIFSVMWSEHASYKNSVKLLKTLPKEGSYMLAKAGEENAGVVDIGDGLAICFKIESHNHPSALEPYHGAATGVGGILRDIFTMGARPIAAMNSLRFGDPKDPKVRHLIKGVVDGIADYGNCFGVPTVGGEIYFEDCYEGNPLVNAMAVGLVKHSGIARSAASGAGNLVVYVGAKTGRDGIHGATFASVDLSEQSSESRTAVQVGDPFYEKLLQEATLEVIAAGLVVGIQDMGAAGLTCSSSEMAGKGGVGIALDVAQVPQRETGMSAYEIMLSESQERMLLIIRPDNFKAVEAIFHKWDLDSAIIGIVNDDGLLRVFENGELKASIPAEYLVLGGKAPVYERVSTRPDYQDVLLNDPLDALAEPADYNEALLKLLSDPNLCSRKSVWQEYDHMVQIGTTVEPGSDAAVIALKDTDKAIALSTDCNSRYCYLDPFEGAKAAVAESALNVACAGATPVAITNCLNFGNPYKPDVYWGFSEVIRGMGDACKALNTPVTGGNVSFYNENPSSAVYPTPVIGMLGVMNDYRQALTQFFAEPGDLVFLLGKPDVTLGGSQYLKTMFGKVGGVPPRVDLRHHQILIGVLNKLAEESLLASAHDVSDGGLAVALAECCFGRKSLGIVSYISIDGNKPTTYFGECAGKVIISFRPQNIDAVKEILVRHSCAWMLLGSVCREPFLMINNDIHCPLSDLVNSHSTGWENNKE